MLATEQNISVMWNLYSKISLKINLYLICTLNFVTFFQLSDEEGNSDIYNILQLTTLAAIIYFCKLIVYCYFKRSMGSAKRCKQTASFRKTHRINAKVQCYYTLNFLLYLYYSYIISILIKINKLFLARMTSHDSI